MKLPVKLDLIGVRIASTVAVVLLGLAAVIATGLFGLHQLERHMSDLVTVNTVKSDAASQMRLAIVLRTDAVRNIALTNDVNAMQDDQRRIEQFVKTYTDRRAQLLQLGLTAAEQASLAQVDAAEAKAAPLLKQAQALARMMQPDVAAETMTARFGPVQKDWMAAIDALAASVDESRARMLQAAQATRSRTEASMGIVGALAFAAGALLAALQVRGITRRLRRAVVVTQNIAGGDLRSNASPAQHDGGDEVGQTLSALGTMQGRLSDTISEVRSAVQSLQTASNEIAAGTNDLAARTEQSASSLQQTASSMEQLTATVANSTQNAGLASQLASSAAAVAERGGEIVARVVATMQDIDGSSRKIGEIIGVIDGIAFQTNILALNAAVEAARAGDGGRGFAVVASEVRMLAQRSAQAAREIKSLIGASVEKTETGTRLVNEAGTTMGEIVGSIRRVSQVVREISTASAEQATGISQIGVAIQRIDQMTQQNSALVEQSAAAADSMREQSERLSQAVGSFRLDTSAAAAAPPSPAAAFA